MAKNLGWPHDQKWAQPGWPKTAEDIWSCIEFGLWMDREEKDRTFIPDDLIKEVVTAATDYVEWGDDNKTWQRVKIALEHYKEARNA